MTEDRVYAECPNCGAVFRVPEALREARRVRCGQCRVGFDLAPAWVDQPWGIRRRAEGVVGAEGEVVGAPAAPSGPTPRPAVPLRAGGPAKLPPAGPSLLRVILLMSLGLALVVTLVGQVLWFTRNEIAAHPGLRPAATRLCAFVGCTLPPWRELDAFRLHGARMAEAREAPGALSAQVTMINRARFVQPAPVLVLQLRGARGEVVGARAFEPHEYLPAAVAATGFAPDEEVPVTLRLKDVMGAQDFDLRVRW